MKRCLGIVVLLLMSVVSAQAEGFHLMDWAARGMGLAGGMVGRANDPSAVAYNAAGITQLPGTRVMAGGATVTPYCGVEGEFMNGAKHTTQVTPSTWLMGHGYATHQLNDDVWLGMGMFSRFGTGVNFASDWFGRYSMYDVGLQTLSAVPTVAYKVTDKLSVSLGIELMYASLYLGQKVPMGPNALFGDADMRMQAAGMGVGAHLGLHYKFNDQWAMGLAYKSPVKMTLNGGTELSPWGENPYRANPAFSNTVLPAMRNVLESGVNGTVVLPDSLALGVTWTPIPNLSVEVGTIWSRWSTYGSLDIYFASGYEARNDKQFTDGINFNASVEYSPLDWLTLRAGYIYESPVTNKSYADFIVPNTGRDVVSLGVGFKQGDWTLDLAWQHLWNHSLNYYTTQTAGIRDAGVRGAAIQNAQSDAFAITIGYTF